MDALLTTEVPGFPLRRGKVRDVYDLGNRLVIVATDRISAFDWVMPTPIPGKGKILTEMTLFWFRKFGVLNHFVSDDVRLLPPPFQPFAGLLSGRTMICRKAEVIPFECVARGYLAGSGWKEYQHSGTVCGLALPGGLREAERLPEPIFTPATKAESGHDENVPFELMAAALGQETACAIRRQTLDLYTQAAAYAAQCGILLADTKFEFGRLADGSIILIDEALTPDSSRFWSAEGYVPGRSPPSYDKQFLRDWLETTGWDKASPPPDLPEEIVRQTAARYQEALQRLTR